MIRAEVTQKILSQKRLKRLSWKTIVAEIGGGSAVYLTAALMGRMKLRPEQAERAAKLFDLGEDEKCLLQEIPYRGALPTRRCVVSAAMRATMISGAVPASPGEL